MNMSREVLPWREIDANRESIAPQDRRQEDYNLTVRFIQEGMDWLLMISDSGEYAWIVAPRDASWHCELLER
jgi:hypothetical protein